MSMPKFMFMCMHIYMLMQMRMYPHRARRLRLRAGRNSACASRACAAPHDARPCARGAPLARTRAASTRAAHTPRSLTDFSLGRKTAPPRRRAASNARRRPAPLRRARGLGLRAHLDDVGDGHAHVGVQLRELLVPHLLAGRAPPPPYIYTYIYTHTYIRIQMYIRIHICERRNPVVVSRMCFGRFSPIYPQTPPVS